MRSRTGDRVLAFSPGRRFVVEGVRDPETGEFFVVAVYHRVRAPHVDAEASDAATMLLVGGEAERAIDYVESWLAEEDPL
jgi:hypothetical protein